MRLRLDSPASAGLELASDQGGEWPGRPGADMKLGMWLALFGALSILALACGSSSGSNGPREASDDAFDRFEECGLDVSSEARENICVDAVGANEDDGGACDDAMIGRFECFSNLSCDEILDPPFCLEESDDIFDNCDDPFEV